VPTYQSNPDKPCETKSASICSTTTSVVSAVSRGTTTTSTSTSSTCATILGCNVENKNTATRVSACSSTKTKQKRSVARTAAPARAMAPVARRGSGSDGDCVYKQPAIIYPKNPKDQSSIQKIRDKLKQIEELDGIGDMHEAKSDALRFTAFFWVEQLDSVDLEELNQMEDDVSNLQICMVNEWADRGLQVRWAYHYEPFNLNLIRSGANLPLVERSFENSYSGFSNENMIDKRDLEASRFWELSQISTPKGKDWYSDPNFRDARDPNQVIFRYFYDGSSGEGQYIYVAEDGILEDHPVTPYLSTFLPTSVPPFCPSSHFSSRCFS